MTGLLAVGMCCLAAYVHNRRRLARQDELIRVIEKKADQALADSYAITAILDQFFPQPTGTNFKTVPAARRSETTEG